MIVPKNMTEKEVLECINTVINQLINSIRPFGYYSRKDGDLRQQAYLFAIEALSTGKYDESRPLGGFLRTCIINRFISLSRDKFCRTEQPCKKCPFNDPEMKINQSACGVYDSKQKCEKYKTYYDRNKTKRDLMTLHGKIPLHGEILSHDYKPFEEIDNKDLIDSIKEKLTPSSRETLQDIMEEKKVKKHRIDKLKEEIHIHFTANSNEDHNDNEE